MHRLGCVHYKEHGKTQLKDADPVQGEEDTFPPQGPTIDLANVSEHVVDQTEVPDHPRWWSFACQNLGRSAIAGGRNSGRSEPHKALSVDPSNYLACSTLLKATQGGCFCGLTSLPRHKVGERERPGASFVRAQMNAPQTLTAQVLLD
jgi:hypothetical protein